MHVGIACRYVDQQASCLSAVDRVHLGCTTTRAPDSNAIATVFVQVYKLNNSSSPEVTVKTWEEVPEGAIKVFAKCRYAGQPLVDPHATKEERWPAVENGLARLLWRLTGSNEGCYDKCLRNLRRYAGRS